MQLTDWTQPLVASDGIVLAINTMESLIPLMETIVKKDQRAFAINKPGESEFPGLRTRIIPIRNHHNHALETHEKIRNLYGTSAKFLRLFIHDEPPNYNIPQTFIDFQKIHTPTDPVQWMTTIFPRSPDNNQGGKNTQTQTLIARFRLHGGLEASTGRL